MTTKFDPIPLTLEDMAAGFRPLGNSLQSALALAALWLEDKGDLYLDTARKVLVDRMKRDTSVDALREAGEEGIANEFERDADKLIATIEQIVEGVRASVKEVRDEKATSPG